MAFVDPEVGAVMGRVVPRNNAKSLLTRLLSLERSGGYQVDQQARYNLDLFPQYGGTVGGFRRSVVLDLGGFDARTLAEDTDLSARLFINGWRILYANHAECYEQVPDSWSARFRQLRRWAHGHNRALAVNLMPLLRSRKITAGKRSTPFSCSSSTASRRFSSAASPPMRCCSTWARSRSSPESSLPSWSGVSTRSATLHRSSKSARRTSSTADASGCTFCLACCTCFSSIVGPLPPARSTRSVMH